MTAIDEIVSVYGAAWLEVDDAKRRRLLEIAWSEDGVYQDPTAEVSGRDALVQHIAGFQKRLPGSLFTMVIAERSTGQTAPTHAAGCPAA